MTKRRGLLIAVEGCDRGGKTTQCKHLQEWLSRHFSLPNEYVKFPVYIMARDDLEGRIDDGMTLVLDRYACSGVAYTSAKGLPLEWCKAPDGGLPKPDLTIFLDVPIEGSSSRDGFGEERYEKRDFQVMFVDGTGSIEEVILKIQNKVESRISSLLEDLRPLDHFDW